jgi:Ser/Thr protein kinase RdoA (MazF antagonist)
MTATLADYAELSPDLVIAAVESTGCLSDARVLALNSYENRVYQIGMEEGPPLVAKFYRPQRWTDAQILEEHAFSLELAAAELPVIAPMADEGGKTLHEHHGFRFALFQRKGGQGLEAGDLDQLYRVGLVLGRLHAIGAQRPFVHRPALTVERFLDTPSALILAGGFLPASHVEAYRRIVTTLREKIMALGLDAYPGIRTQGDCHPGNAIWTRDDGPWLLDFDDCQTAPAVQDLWMLLCGNQREQERQLAELLEGYNTFFDFDARQLVLVEALRSLRMIHYAGWLAVRWSDPAFPRYFPWFNTEAYWLAHIAELEEQGRRMDEEPLALLG